MVWLKMLQVYVVTMLMLRFKSGFISVGRQLKIPTGRTPRGWEHVGASPQCSPSPRPSQGVHLLCTYLIFEADHIGLHLHEVLHAVDELRVVPVADPGDLVALLRLELLQRNLCGMCALKYREKKKRRTLQVRPEAGGAMLRARGQCSPVKYYRTFYHCCKYAVALLETETEPKRFFAKGVFVSPQHRGGGASPRTVCPRTVRRSEHIFREKVGCMCHGGVLEIVLMR